MTDGAQRERGRSRMHASGVVIECVARFLPVWKTETRFGGNEYSQWMGGSGLEITAPAGPFVTVPVQYNYR